MIMKTRFILLLLAAVLLGSVSVNAQSKKAPKKAESETPLKGDVNGDGKVDVADIVAILKIMKDGGGTSEGTKYYWYVGQTDPSTMTSISPIVTDNTSPGWRLIGTTLPTYSSSNKLFEYVEGGEIVTGTSLAKQYIAIPAESSACPRDGLGNDASTVDIYTKLSNVTISGVTYKVYETVGKSKKLAIDIY